MNGLKIFLFLIGKGWIVLQTDRAYYSLKLGGYSEAGQIERSQYNIANFPLTGKTIARIYTDDFLIIIETTEEDTLKYSPDISINSDGETSFGITYLSKEQSAMVKQEYVDLLVELR